MEDNAKIIINVAGSARGYNLAVLYEGVARILAKKCQLLRFFLFVFRYLLLNFTERRP